MSMTVGLNAGMFRILSTMNRLENERALTMVRLATGQRINRASDDPAGLIALNALNAEYNAINAALANNQRSQSMLNVADGVLTEVSSLVTDVEELVLAAQGSTVTADEKAAYQAQIDNAVDAIDRLINQAEFNGTKIFNGANRINAYASDPAAVKDVRVYSRDPNVTGNVSLSVVVTAAAEHAHTNSASGFDLSNGLSAQTVIQVTGQLGTATITMSTYTSAQIKSAINAQSDITGVSATTGAGGRLVYSSTDTGSDAFVTVSVISGDTAMLANGSFSKVSGSDAQATVNGQTADARGTRVYYSGSGVSLSFNLEDDTPGTHTITVTGGGAEFQIGTDARDRETIGVGYMNSFELGRSDIGYLSSLKSGGVNCLTAAGSNGLQIAREAGSQVVGMAARVGTFNKYQLGSTINVLQTTQEQMASAISLIQDVDYAAETARLERQNVLISAAVSMLNIVSNQQSSVLTLLQ